MIFDSIVSLLKSRISGSREKNIVKAVSSGVIARIISILTQFISTKILIDYLGGKEGFGIFTTILTILSWIQLTNFGFGLGLQNTLIVAVAKKDILLQKRLIRTTQVALSVICFLCFIIWTVGYLNKFPNWVIFFNASHSIYAKYVNASVYVTGLVALVTVWTSYISPFYSANQSLHKLGYWTIAGQIGAFSGLIIATQLKLSLPYILLFYTGITSFVGIVNAVWLMIKIPKFHFPNIKDFSFFQLKEILGVGSAFFLIQITALLQYNLDNFIISGTLGPAEVTPYSLVQRLFMVFTNISALVFVPLWSAFGNAIACNDWDWVKRRYQQMRIMMLGSFVLFWIFLLVFGQTILRFWVGPNIIVPYSLFIMVGVMMFCRVWLDVHSLMCNALNVVRINAILGIPVGLIQVGIMYIGIQKWGLNGMILGVAFSLLITGGWILPLLAHNNIRKRHAGFINSNNNLQQS